MSPCRPLQVVCAAPDRDALNALKRAAVGAEWELSPGAVAVSAVFYWRPPPWPNGFAEPVAVGVVAFLLVGLNGGAGSPLVAIWLSVLGGICLALPPLVSVQPATLLASAAAVGTDPGTAAIPLVRAVSGVIVVTRLGKTTRDLAAHLHQQLVNLDAPVLGVVVNAAGGVGGRNRVFRFWDPKMRRAAAEGNRRPG